MKGGSEGWVIGERREKRGGSRSSNSWKRGWKDGGRRVGRWKEKEGQVSKSRGYTEGWRKARIWRLGNEIRGKFSKEAERKIIEELKGWLTSIMTGRKNIFFLLIIWLGGKWDNMLGFIFRIWGMPLNETRYEKYLTEIQQVLTRTETISLILVFVGSKGLRVCVCVCSVIYSEARFASSCPNGVPMTLPAADLHHRGRQRKRETGGFGEGRGFKDSGKVNIIFNLRILLDFLLWSRSFYFFLLCFLCEQSCALACYIYIHLSQCRRCRLLECICKEEEGKGWITFM